MAFVLWHDGVGDGFDRCTLLPLVDGFVLGGTARLPALGAAAQAGYRIEVDEAWAVRRAVVRGAADAREPEEHDLELTSDGAGGWSRDGVAAPEFDGCVDVALAFSPAGLTTSLRRLDLAVGEQASFDVVRLDATGREAIRVQQGLRRIDRDRYVHDPGDGPEVVVHVGPQGLVTEVEDAWKAVATG